MDTFTEHPHFDEVKVGDTLRWVQITRGFMAEVRHPVSTVERITANTVFLKGGSRLYRSNWYEKSVSRKPGRLP